MTINSDSQFEHDVVNVRFMPFRRLELALHRIIDMAIPQHLNDLEQHKININKVSNSLLTNCFIFMYNLLFSFAKAVNGIFC